MRLLYLSYFYPPLGGPAVLRNVKTVKYLSQMGFEIDVLTLEEPEYLYRDESLLAQCHERNLIRTPSWDPMTLLKKLDSGKQTPSSSLYLNTPERIKLLIRQLYPIDNKIGWLPFLLKAGNAAIRQNDYDLIYVSLGPFSAGVGAWLLSRQSGIPYVVDMRDYWTLLSDYDLQGNALNRWFSQRWEARIHRKAALIVTATEGIGKDIARVFGTDLSAKMVTIYNGWDEEDFDHLLPTEQTAGYTLAYFGNIYARRSLKHFYAAVKRLRQEGLLPNHTRIRLHGNFFRETLQEIEASGIKDLIEVIPQLEHCQALAAMQAADVLVLTLNSSGPEGTLSAKLFEYLRCQKPILAMVPAHNEAARLLRSLGHDLICAMESTDSICHCLKRLFASSPGTYAIPWQLERKSQITRLAEALRGIV